MGAGWKRPTLGLRFRRSRRRRCRRGILGLPDDEKCVRAGTIGAAGSGPAFAVGELVTARRHAAWQGRQKRTARARPPRSKLGQENWLETLADESAGCPATSAQPVHRRRTQMRDHGHGGLY